MNTQVKVPDFMLKAAEEWAQTHNAFGTVMITGVMEAALRALMENPIVPTDEQLTEMNNYSIGKFGGTLAQLRYQYVEWQRRMFLSPTDPRRDKIRRILHTFGILSEDEKIDAILSAFEPREEK